MGEEEGILRVFIFFNVVKTEEGAGGRWAGKETMTSSERGEPRL